MEFLTGNDSFISWIQADISITTEKYNKQNKTNDLKRKVIYLFIE